MHAFLIVSKNKQTALDYTLGECKKNQVDKFDIDILTFEKAVGIEDVRNVQKKLFLKPIKSKTKAVILDGTSGLTTEAQNALLKVLEEPPASTIIYIISGNKELLLPTILSRCKIIDLKDKSFELSKQEITQYLNILISLTSNGVGERLRLAQDLTKNKEKIIPELEKMIIVARQEVIKQIMENDKGNIFPSSFWGVPLSGTTPESPTAIRDSGQVLRPRAQDRGARMTDYEMVSKYLNILISLQKTYTILKTTNVNQRLTLENLFLNL